MALPSGKSVEPIARLIAQYFELVDFRHLDIPSSAVLKAPTTQESLYDVMFNEARLAPIIPPAAYRLKVLKEIISRIENDQQWDPEEDEITESLMMAMMDLMSQPSNNPLSEKIDTDDPPLSFVSYTVPSSIDGDLQEKEHEHDKQRIITYESRGLIYGSGSTGFRTWEAALHLGTYLSSSSSSSSVSLIRGKRVIELGAGTGFISMLCKKYLGAEKVLMTDGNAKLVDLFNGPCLGQNSFSTSRNKRHTIQARKWVWGEALPGHHNDHDDAAEGEDGKESEQFDVALGADLTYDKSIIPLLIDAIWRLFSSHGVKKFVLSATIRNKETFNAFLDACRARRFIMEKSTFESPPFENQTGFFHATKVPIWPPFENQTGYFHATQIPIWTYIISPPPRLHSVSI